MDQVFNYLNALRHDKGTPALSLMLSVSVPI